ncbi:GH23746, partial [Drosophila grimshawi]
HMWRHGQEAQPPMATARLQTAPAIAPVPCSMLHVPSGAIKSHYKVASVDMQMRCGSHKGRRTKAN